MTSSEAKEEALIIALANALRDAPHDRASLSAAAERIVGGNGGALSDALLAAHRSVDDDEPSAVFATMTSLEAMMDEAPGVAGYLMARLYPIADRRRLHAIHDAIELWMNETSSRAVAESLTRLSGEGVRPKLRERYEDWATKIRGRLVAAREGGQSGGSA